MKALTPSARGDSIDLQPPNKFRRLLDRLRPRRGEGRRRLRLVGDLPLRLRRWRGEIELALARRFGLSTREDRVFLLLIPIVGVLAGLLGVSVHLLINGLERLLWGPGNLLDIAAQAPWWRVLGALAAGGLLVGLVVLIGRQKVSGQGMSVLIEAVALHGGRVPVRPVILRALAAIATVAGGGSLGREGPMIRLGAMISSRLAGHFELPPRQVKILLGCGAAAGLAAAYNIPVGGALFAMEVILGNFALEIFGPIVISSVIATLIARAVEGNVPDYGLAGPGLRSAWEILAFTGLGLVGAVASVLFILAVSSGRDVVEKRLSFLPPAIRPMLGLSLLGAAVVYLDLPEVLGSGAATAARAIGSSLPASVLLGLAAAKVLATVLTTASGGSGGLFTPSLAVGALLGGAFGQSVQILWPQLGPPTGAYVVVGMAAVAAGTSHAPISAILILFELTRNYDLILPLMTAAILSSLVASRLYRPSIYTEALHRQGIEFNWRMEEAALAGLSVDDLMQQDEAVLAPDDRYRTVVERFLTHHRQRLFVLGPDSRLLGAVSLHDIKHVLDEDAPLDVVMAHDLMRPVDVVLRLGEGLHRAAEVFASTPYERLPVVAGPGDNTFQGFLSKQDLLTIYSQEVLGRPAKLATFVSERASAARDYVELPEDFTVRQVPVPPDLVGRSLAEARLHQARGVKVIQLKRRFADGTQRLIPDGATVLRADDRMILVGPTASVEAFTQEDRPATGTTASG